MSRKTRKERARSPKPSRRPSWREAYSKLEADNKGRRRREHSILVKDVNVMKWHARYENSATVFGSAMSVAELVDRISKCNWRASLIEASYWSAMLGNGDGPMDKRLRIKARDAIRSLKASNSDGAAKLQNANSFIDLSSDIPVLVNEEAIATLQHLIVLHGSETSVESPTPGETVLWILATTDQLGKWENENDKLSLQEQLVAEISHSARFNRSEDAVSALLRADKLFKIVPANGSLSNGTWSIVHQKAFGKNYEEYFDEFLMPLYLLSYVWGRDGKSDNYPVLSPSRLSEFSSKAPAFLAQLKDFSSTREELIAEIRKRMRPDGVFPHAPTALLYRPFVDLGGDGIVASSPQNVRNVLKTGVWNRYRIAVSELDKKYKNEWPISFGNILELYIRNIAKEADNLNMSAKILLPTHPGASDEIEDVVVLERSAVVMFSIKSMMMRADIAMEAKSRREVVDWYEKYFFEAKTSKGGETFRGGAIRQLSSRIDMVRSGRFASLGVAPDVFIHPIIVTYDNLGENHVIYEWIESRCLELGLLTQKVGRPAFISVDVFEQLMAMHARNKSIVNLLNRRHSHERPERLDVVIASFSGLDEMSLRVPGWQTEYEALVKRMAPAIGISAERIISSLRRRSPGAER